MKKSIEFTKIGKDRLRGQCRAGDINLSKVNDLQSDIEEFGLQLPLPVEEVIDRNWEYELRGGHHRWEAIRRLRNKNPEKWRKIPCRLVNYVETAHASIGEERKIDMRRDNIHGGTTCNPNTPAEWVYLLEELLSDSNGKIFSGLKISKKSDHPAIQKTAYELLKREAKGYKDKGRSSIVESLFAKNGQKVTQLIRKYTKADLTDLFKGGLVNNWVGDSGEINNGILVYSMSSNDYLKKPGMVFQKICDQTGSGLCTQKPFKVILIGHVDAPDDQKVRDTRDKMFNLVTTLNNFVKNNLNKGADFHPLIDELYWLGQFINRTGKDAINNELENQLIRAL
tara:strand:- start:830 stop:1846 length:1017 start_codon:yes stop_codon:yes gene_type:complete